MKNPFLRFKKTLLEYGLEYFGLYYGSYSGIVVDRDDPENRGRLKISCPDVWGDQKNDVWVLPRGMFIGNKIGFNAIPQKDDNIWITFINGDANKPLWEYGWMAKDKGHELSSPDRYFLATPKGHLFVIDEKDDKIYISYKDGKGIFIDRNKVYIAKENATIPSVLGDKNADLHKDVIQLIIEIIQAFNTAPVTPMDGGASFKAGLIASLSTTLVNAYLYKNVDADQTKSNVVFLE